MPALAILLTRVNCVATWIAVPSHSTPAGDPVCGGQALQARPVVGEVIHTGLSDCKRDGRKEDWPNRLCSTVRGSQISGHVQTSCETCCSTVPQVRKGLPDPFLFSDSHFHLSCLYTPLSKHFGKRIHRGTLNSGKESHLSWSHQHLNWPPL